MLGGAMLAAAFITWQRRAGHPMVPPALFRSRTFSAANAVSFFMYAGLFGALFQTSQLLQTGLGYTPLQAGIRLLPWTLPPMVIAPLAGTLVGRHGNRPFMVLGLALLVRNPGGLFGPVSEEELGTAGVTSSRNPVLSGLLQEVQLPDSDRVICENRGTGIPTMLEQLRRSGAALVKFSNAISHFTVLFIRTGRGGTTEKTRADEAPRLPALTGRPAEIMALFTNRPELTAFDIAQATGLSRAMTQRHLARLVADGQLTVTAPPSSRNRAYRLPPTANPPK